MRVVITTTAMSTMIVEFTTSFLVGHATLRNSPFTSPRYCLGPIFSRLGAADGARRFPPLDAGALGLSVPCFAIMRLVCRFIDTAAPSSGGCRVIEWSSRRSLQGRRDSNPQPPVLETGALPIELLPSGRGRAGPARIAAVPKAVRGGGGAVASRGPIRS